jgi:hypothetical protein
LSLRWKHHGSERFVIIVVKSNKDDGRKSSADAFFRDLFHFISSFFLPSSHILLSLSFPYDNIIISPFSYPSGFVSSFGCLDQISTNSSQREENEGILLMRRKKRRKGGTCRRRARCCDGEDGKGREEGDFC